MGNLAHKYRQQIDQNQTQKRTVRILKKNKFTNGEKGLFLLFFVILLVFVAFMISNQARIYSMERDIYKLEQKIGEQSLVNEALQLQVIELSAPDRILHIATEQLGMTLDDNKVKVVQN